MAYPQPNVWQHAAATAPWSHVLWIPDSVPDPHIRAWYVRRWIRTNIPAVAATHYSDESGWGVIPFLGPEGGLCRSLVAYVLPSGG